jgi:hypothetical protein
VKTLPAVTGVVEAGVGLGLMCFPSAVVTLLLGSGLETHAAVTLGRVAARALAAAMLQYNLAVAAFLAFGGLGLGLVGAALWPAVVLHAAMAAWCISRLRRQAA